MSNPNPSPATRFKSKGTSAFNQPIGIKLSKDMEECIRKVDNGNFSAWIREAIAEKLAKLEKEKLVV